MMQKVNLGVIFFLVLCTTHYLEATRCLKCDKANSVDDCTQEIECDPTEECFLEKATTPALEIVINAGCKSKQVCQLVAGILGRKRSVGCFECCDSVRCNANLCQAAQRPGDNCGDCKSIHNFTTCSTFSKCQDDEACYLKAYISHVTLSYDVGCEAKSKCYEQAKIKEETAFGEVTIVPDHRKRIGNDLVFCQACCTGDRCNVLYPDCPAMLKAMKPGNFT